MHLRRETRESSENRAWRGFPADHAIPEGRVFHNSCGWRCAYLVNSSAKSCGGREYPPNDQKHAGDFYRCFKRLGVAYV